MNIRIYDTTISVDGEGDFSSKIKDTKNWQNYKDTLKFLGSIGFYVGEDILIKKNYKRLNDYHNQGRYADLEFKSEVYQNGFKIIFFQNKVFENRNGGYYDFSKFEKMPYLIRLQYQLTENKLVKFLKNKGFGVERKNEAKGIDFIINDYINSWHHPQKEKFDLKEVEGQTSEYSYNNTDRDGKTIYNGDIKYFRNYGGYLIRGRVYHNINNMWWVLHSGQEVSNIAAFQLFDLKETDKLGRVAIRRTPDAYIKKKEQLSLCSTKELLNELKRRNIKCSIKN